jgi:hypothetical protein
MSAGRRRWGSRHAPASAVSGLAAPRHLTAHRGTKKGARRSAQHRMQRIPGTICWTSRALSSTVDTVAPPRVMRLSARIRPITAWPPSRQAAAAIDPSLRTTAACEESLLQRFGSMSSRWWSTMTPRPVSPTMPAGGATIGPLGFTGSTNGMVRFGFSTSLRDIARFAAREQARKPSDGGLGFASRPGSPKSIVFNLP